MSSDRWRQVEDLCHAALAYHGEERRAFLANACQGDEGLRREVESLLAQESSAEGFMSVPAAALAGSAGLDQPGRTLIGARLGSYTIRSLLGVGGMGEVYRAHDETLGREVAIKVLSPALTAEPDRRARFEREARMLATVNHPHIGAIYGVEEADGVRALVLELVEGETLAERIARSVRDPIAGAPGLSVNEALTIARQIADALETAHEKGADHSSRRRRCAPDLARGFCLTVDGAHVTLRTSSSVLGGCRRFRGRLHARVRSERRSTSGGEYHSARFTPTGRGVLVCPTWCRQALVSWRL